MSQRAAIYARVSTDEQAETGYGLSFQIGKCEEHAERRGYVVLDTITDDYTGKTAFRPGMNALLDLITAQRVEVVIIHRTDRLGRRGSVQDMLEAEIEARGARVEYVSATYDRSTAQGRAMRRVQGVFDEFDYEALVEKLRDHKVEAVRGGSIITTRPPYGYRVVPIRNDKGKRAGARLEIVEDEAHVVRQVYHWYVDGGETGDPLSIRAIASRLTAQRIPTRGDAPNGNRSKSESGVWGDAVVQRLLSSEVYVGRWHYRKTKSVPVQGSDKMKQVAAPRDTWLCVNVPAIVSEELFEAARQRATRNAELAKRNRKHEYLFCGLLTCDHCKHAYVGWCTYATKHGEVARYRCNGKRHDRIAPCGMPPVSEPALDAVIWEWVKGIVRHPEHVAATLQERQRLADEQNARIRELITTTDRLIADKRAEQERVLTLYKKGKLDEDRWEVEDTACQREIEGHEAQRAQLAARLVKPHYTPDYLADVQTACARIALGLEHFTLAEKRKTYELLELRGRLAIEDGVKVVYAECVLDVQRLRLAESRVIASTLSKERMRPRSLLAGVAPLAV